MYKFVMGRILEDEIIVLTLNDNLLSHADLAKIYLQGFSVIIAGFVSFGKDGEIEPYGKSISLNVGTEGLDKNYFKQYVNMSICAQDTIPPMAFSTEPRKNFILSMGFKGASIPEEWERMAEHEEVCPFLNKFYAENYSPL